MSGMETRNERLWRDVRENGFSHREAAAIYGVSIGRVGQILRAEDSRRRGDEVAEADAANGKRGRRTNRQIIERHGVVAPPPPAPSPPPPPPVVVRRVDALATMIAEMPIAAIMVDLDTLGGRLNALNARLPAGCKFFSGGVKWFGKACGNTPRPGSAYCERCFPKVWVAARTYKPVDSDADIAA